MFLWFTGPTFGCEGLKLQKILLAPNFRVQRYLRRTSLTSFASLFLIFEATNFRFPNFLLLHFNLTPRTCYIEDPMILRNGKICRIKFIMIETYIIYGKLNRTLSWYLTLIKGNLLCFSKHIMNIECTKRFS